MDCSSGPASAVHVRRDGDADRHPRRGEPSCDADRHFSGDRNSGDVGHLELHGHFAGRDGDPRRRQFRAGAGFDGQRHRAHRKPVAQRHCGREDFLQPGGNVEAAISQVGVEFASGAANDAAGHFPAAGDAVQRSRTCRFLQASLGSDTLSEQQLFDLATNNLAARHGHGARRPDSVSLWRQAVRQIMIDIDPEKLYAWKLSAADVSNAVNAQNLILPAGTAKIGQQEYNIRLNSSPEVVAAHRRSADQDHRHADDLHSRRGQRARRLCPQTNVVHVERQARRVAADVEIRGLDAGYRQRRESSGCPVVMADMLCENLQNHAVCPINRYSCGRPFSGVVKEAAIAAGLTGVMILLFLGSWRSTLIVVISIPLSILVSIIVLSFLGQTLNIMTLGGMALAVGILVDDATVEIENIHRNLHQGKQLVPAILDGAQQIAMPAFVVTLCICIVFVPVVFISGAAKSLFTPLAMAVVFAMLTSYLLSRTLVPTMVHYLLAGEVELYGGKTEEGVKHKPCQSESHLAVARRVQRALQ